MTSDLGFCPRVADPTADTVGLWVNPGITLDCQGHTITGPGDQLKNSFGVRVGMASSPTPAENAVVTNCSVTKFWWGVYVQNASGAVVDGNHLYANGWMAPDENGNGYGLNVSGSQNITVRNNRIDSNGNEGFHLSDSTGVAVE
ncbi:MAG: hypothetical protein C5B48_06875, partial [Candidatus Rokuibacteriota bacterium]